MAKQTKEEEKESMPAFKDARLGWGLETPKGKTYMRNFGAV